MPRVRFEAKKQTFQERLRKTANETKTNVFIDRSKWGPGPWDKEPDEWFWYDKSTSYLCLVRRHEKAGTLCGYVGVGQGNPLFTKAYDPANMT